MALRDMLHERTAFQAVIWWEQIAGTVDGSEIWPKKNSWDGKYIGVSENGGFPQQPLFFLLKLIIFGWKPPYEQIARVFCVFFKASDGFVQDVFAPINRYDLFMRIPATVFWALDVGLLVSRRCVV